MTALNLDEVVSIAVVLLALGVGYWLGYRVGR